MSSELPNSLDILKGLRYLPSLDGWRAVSIGLVLMSHSKKTSGYPHQFDEVTRWIPDGGFGVQFFFVISGFLITWLLLKENKKSGTNSLYGFYWRRSLRILPAYLVFLLVLLTLSFASVFSMPPMSWVALCTYTVNYLEVPWTGSHVWSLSIEEQFYLIWPFVFIPLVRCRANFSWLIGVLAIPILLFPMFRVLGYLGGYRQFPFNSYSFLLVGDAIAVGCAGAVVLWNLPKFCDWLSNRRSGVLICALVLIGVPHVLTRLFLLGPLTVPFGLTLSSIGICFLVLQSIVCPQWKVYRFLQFQILAWVGTLSYSIYLWQQIFCSDPSLFGLSDSCILFAFPYWLAPTFIVALMSHYLVERPFLRLKRKTNQVAGEA